MQKIFKINGATLKTENPNNKLYTFYGSLKMVSNPKAIPIDNDNVVLRGSTVKNIDWCIGLVVFTGKDTKIMMNSKNPPSKRSYVERRTNYYLFAIFSILFFITSLSALLSISISYN
mmetsp:Transcript_2353/g.288  ORF Transcript_2353/g.288 Transcript_2353/m.288 type:complete len:117 (-) Transcript_2353:3063-3413(-)